MKFQFLPENFSRSENAPPFETRKIRQFEVERIFLENKKMVQDNISDPKQFIFKVIRHKCRNKKYKEMLPLRGQAIGIEYNPQIVSFITNNWNIENAMNKSPSLKRAIQCFASRLSSI